MFQLIYDAFLFPDSAIYSIDFNFRRSTRYTYRESNELSISISIALYSTNPNETHFTCGLKTGVRMSKNLFLMKIVIFVENRGSSNEQK